MWSIHMGTNRVVFTVPLSIHRENANNRCLIMCCLGPLMLMARRISGSSSVRLERLACLKVVCIELLKYCSASSTRIFTLTERRWFQQIFEHFQYAGVCLSHAALNDANIRYGQINSDDVVQCFSTLYWITGVLILITSTLHGAKRVITTQPPSAELQFRLIEKHRITYILNSPYMTTMFSKCDLLKSTDLSSLRIYLTGGSRIPKDIPNQINKYLPNGYVNVAYGMSEMTIIIAADFPVPRGGDTVGRLSRGLRAKIVDDAGERLGIGESGEICLLASHQPLGYYNNAAGNSELFDDEGFILTGDIGHFDADGYLYIIDRKKEILKFRCTQISPSSLEAHLIMSPLIKAVCITGIPHDVDGDLVAACVVRNPGADIDEPMVHQMIDGTLFAAISQ